MNQYRSPGTVATKFTRHLGTVGMYRDNSLAAATRTREIAKLREAKEKTRARLAKEILQKKTIEEQTLAAIELKRKLRKLNRQQRKEEAKNRLQAAIYIQNIWRDYSQWKRQCIARLLFFSARVIQSAVRRKLGREKLNRLVFQKKVKCCIILQRFVRGLIARILLKRLKQSRKLAAKIIQKHIRGCYGRRHANNLKLHASAIKIQCLIRVKKARYVENSLRIKKADKEKYMKEASRMQIEDDAAMKLEMIERDEIRRKKEKEEELRKIKEEQAEKAKEEGIPLLPWRRNTISLADIVELQKQRRKEEEQKQKQIEEAERIKKLKARERRLQELEKKRLVMLQKLAEKRKVEEAEKAKLQKLREDREKEEEENLKHQEYLRAKQRQKVSAERRAQILKNSQEKQEKERLRKEKEEESIRLAEQKRLEHLRRMEKIRLEQIRQKAAENKRNREREEELLAEQRKIEEINRQVELKEKLLADKKRREEIFKRIQRQKEQQEKEMKEMKEKLDIEAKERRELLNRKAKALRQNIKERLRREQAENHKVKKLMIKKSKKNKNKTKRNKQTQPGLITYNASVSLEQYVPIKFEKKKTKSIRRKKRSKKAKNNNESIDDILERAEVLLLPKLKTLEGSHESSVKEKSLYNLEVNRKYPLPSPPKRGKLRDAIGKKNLKKDNPLLRAIQWKMKQMEVQQSPRSIFSSPNQESPESSLERSESDFSAFINDSSGRPDLLGSEIHQNNFIMPKYQPKLGSSANLTEDLIPEKGSINMSSQSYTHLQDEQFVISNYKSGSDLDAYPKSSTENMSGGEIPNIKELYDEKERTNDDDTNDLKNESIFVPNSDDTNDLKNESIFVPNSSEYVESGSDDNSEHEADSYADDFDDEFDSDYPETRTE